MLLAVSFSLDAVRRLDVTIYSMQQLFLSIPEYFDLWTPNFHFAQHFPLDILLWGPSRLLCCLRFEAENQVRRATRRRAVWCCRQLSCWQVYIQAGRHTNFKSLLESMGNKVATRRAFDLKSGAHADRLKLQPVPRLVELVSYGTSSTLDGMWNAHMLPAGEIEVTYMPRHASPRTA